LVSSWDEADIERCWDVAFIDHSPSERRVEEITRLANFVKYLVVHDTGESYEKYYGYKKIYSLFKYKREWQEDPGTTVLSNIISLDDL
jgi:hypothetical protein